MDMEEDGFDDDFNRLRLDHQNEGVTKLTPRSPLCRYFTDLPDSDYLHIVVQLPTAGEFTTSSDVTAASLIHFFASLLCNTTWQRISAGSAAADSTAPALLLGPSQTP